MKDFWENINDCLWKKIILMIVVFIGFYSWAAFAYTMVFMKWLLVKVPVNICRRIRYKIACLKGDVIIPSKTFTESSYNEWKEAKAKQKAEKKE